MQSLTIEGELTVFTAAYQKTLLLTFLNTGDELEINLSNVSEIDTAGLQLLILIKREAAQSGKALSFTMRCKRRLATPELPRLGQAFGEQAQATFAHNEE